MSKEFSLSGHVKLSVTTPRARTDLDILISVLPTDTSSGIVGIKVEGWSKVARGFLLNGHISYL